MLPLITLVRGRDPPDMLHQHFRTFNFIPRPTHPIIRRTNKLTAAPGTRIEMFAPIWLLLAGEACLNAGNTVVDNDEESEDSDDDLDDIGC